MIELPLSISFRLWMPQSIDGKLFELAEAEPFNAVSSVLDELESIRDQAQELAPALCCEYILFKREFCSFRHRRQYAKRNLLLRLNTNANSSFNAITASSVPLKAKRTEQVSSNSTKL